MFKSSLPPAINKKREEIILSTSKNPDIQRVKHFKNIVHKHLKIGYFIDGQIIMGDDGSFSQKLWRWKA